MPVLNEECAFEPDSLYWAVKIRAQSSLLILGGSEQIPPEQEIVAEIGVRVPVWGSNHLASNVCCETVLSPNV